MAEERRRTVTVMCSIPNGIELRLYEPGYDDGSGTQRMRVTDAVTLHGPGSVTAGVNSPTGVAETEVDGEFWRAWLTQNEKHPPAFLAAGQVFVKDADG